MNKLFLYRLCIQYSPRKMDYFHTISALHHKLMDYFINIIGIRSLCRIVFKFCDRAMNGLIKSHEHCTSIGIKSDYTFEETEAFDALIIKLTRNSDVFFQQLVKAYFKLKGEDNLMFIDRLYMLEKIGVIDNVDQLMVLKSFRNQAVHEYSAVAFQELYQEALELSPFFITTVQQFKVFLITENILKC